MEVADGGALSVDAQPLSAEQLSALVRSRHPTELAVTIAGGQSVNLQQLMAAIDAVRLGGATQIGLAARASAP